MDEEMWEVERSMVVELFLECSKDDPKRILVKSQGSFGSTITEWYRPSLTKGTEVSKVVRLESAYTVYPILPAILNQSRIIWEVEFIEDWKPLSPLQLAMEEVMSELLE
ncbi:hypothetical protein Tco_1437407 [Tanacetum coccineum]